jgi:hypothetical protein
VGLVALAGAAVALLLPDPAREADLLAERLGAAVGQPARVAGPVAYDYGWPGTLHVARIELGAVGWLGDVAATGTALAGTAELFGRAGQISGDAERLRFAGDGVAFERAVSGAAWRIDATLAGRAVAVVGAGSNVAVQWGDLAATGEVGWQASNVAVDLALAGASAQLLPAGGRGPLGIGGTGLLERQRGGGCDERIDLWLEGIDALHQGLGVFHRGQPLRLNQRRDFGDRQPMQGGQGLTGHGGN